MWVDVSGELIVLQDDPLVRRLVEVAGRIDDVTSGNYALVGGLAVMCRLAAIHRATSDLDTVTDEADPRMIEVLTTTIATPDNRKTERVVIDGVDVDVIETSPITEGDLDGIASSERLFMAGHRWALDTATSVTIRVGGVDGVGGEDTRIQVASPAALVATKAGSILSTRRGVKVASDLVDLYRLVDTHDRSGAIADALASAPFELADLVASSLRTKIIEDPTRALRTMRAAGVELGPLGEEDLLDTFVPLVNVGGPTAV